MDPYSFLEDFERTAEQMQQQLAQSQEAFDNARGEARSSDGSVTVIVAGGGSIETLRLSPAAMKLGHEALARSIIETIRSAQAQAAHAVQDSMRPLLGEGAGMDFLSEQVEAGIAKADAAGAAPERRESLPEVDIDEDDPDDWDPRGGRR